MFDCLMMTIMSLEMRVISIIDFDEWTLQIWLRSIVSRNASRCQTHKYYKLKKNQILNLICDDNIFNAMYNTSQGVITLEFLISVANGMENILYLTEKRKKNYYAKINFDYPLPFDLILIIILKLHVL